MLLACFAWLVWLVYACGVRRIKGLRRICSYFYSFAPKFAHLLCSLPFLLSLYLLDRVALSLCLCGSLGVVVVSFSLTDYTQKKGRAVLVRPLFVCRGLLYLVAALYSSYSSGVSPSIS